MTEVYLALGANVGNPRSNIEKAIELLGAKVRKIEKAPLYRSKAVGYTDQPDFLNTAVRGQTDMSANALFNFSKEVEEQVGRIERFRWGPREIDIDIVFYGNEALQSGQLTIPHPRFQERDFVLQPLNDLNPNMIDPTSKQTVKALLDKLGPSDRSQMRLVT